MCPNGRIVFRNSCRAFPGPLLKHGRDRALFLFRDRKRGTEKKRMKVHVVIATMALATLFCGCVAITENTAMGKDPSAEDAVKRLDDQRSLERVSLHSENDKARILAVGKLNDISRLCQIIKDFNQPTELRIAAFQRIDALGEAERVLRKDSSVCEIVVFGVNVVLPAEWRIRAIQLNSEVLRRCSDEERTAFLIDSSIPLNVRKAALAAIKNLERKGYAQLLEAAVVSNRSDCLELAREYSPSHDEIESIMRSSASRSVKMFCFSSIKDERALKETLDNTLRSVADDTINGKVNTENMKNESSSNDVV